MCLQQKLASWTPFVVNAQGQNQTWDEAHSAPLSASVVGAKSVHFHLHSLAMQLTGKGCGPMCLSCAYLVLAHSRSGSLSCCTTLSTNKTCFSDNHYRRNTLEWCDYVLWKQLSDSFSQADHYKVNPQALLSSQMHPKSLFPPTPHSQCFSLLTYSLTTWQTRSSSHLV